MHFGSEECRGIVSGFRDNDIYIRAVFDEEFADGEMNVRRGFYQCCALGVTLAGLIQWYGVDVGATFDQLPADVLETAACSCD